MRMRKLNLDTLISILTCMLVSSFYVYNLDTKGSFVFFVLTIIITVLSGIENDCKIRLRVGEFQLNVLFFALFCLTSMLWAQNGSYAIDKGVTIIELLVCMSLLMSYYSKFDSIDSLLRVILWSSCIVTVYTLSKYSLSTLVSSIKDGQRIGSTYTNINSIGMLATYGAIVGLYIVLYKHNRIYIPTIVLNVFMSALSGSRKAILVLIFGSTIILLNLNHDKNVLKRIGYVILVLIGVYVVISVFSSLTLFSGVSYRIKRMLYLVTGEGGVDSSTLTRQRFIQIGWEQFKKTPVLGMGIGNPRILANKYTGHNSYLHNNYVELLAGGGIIGFILYYFCHVRILYEIRKYKSLEVSESIIVLSIILGMLIADYGAVSYYSKYTYFFLMVFYIHIGNLKKKSKRECI